MKKRSAQRVGDEAGNNGQRRIQGSLGEPFVMPDIDTLEVKNGMPILPKIPGRVITMEMVKELSEEY